MSKNKEQDVELEIDLLSKGFKRKWLSDNSGYWLQYKFRGPFKLKGRILVETDRRILSVDLDSSTKIDIMDGGSVTTNYKYSSENIKKVLKEVKKVNNTKWTK